jgi:hypothetical protein
MKTNYKIITDPDKLKEFIKWLPELKDGECYYVMLLARDKYFKELGRPTVKLKRFTSNKEHLFDKVKQLECELGSYKNGDIEIPNESLCLYIMPNPRSQIKSAKFITKLFIDLLFNDYKGFNVHQEALTALQKNSSKMRFMDFDFDYTTIEEMSPKINEILNYEAINYIQTRGGFHLLVEIDKVANEYKKNYYNNIMKLPNVDTKGDQLCPMPYCTQGGFTPILHKSEK